MNILIGTMNHVTQLINHAGDKSGRMIIVLIGEAVLLAASGCGRPEWTHPGKAGFERWQDTRECRRDASDLSA